MRLPNSRCALPRRWGVVGMVLVLALAGSSARAAAPVDRACALLNAADVATILPGGAKPQALQQPTDGQNFCSWTLPGSKIRFAIGLDSTRNWKATGKVFDDMRVAAERSHAIVRDEPGLGTRAFSALRPGHERAESVIVAVKGNTRMVISFTGASAGMEQSLALLRPLAKKAIGEL